MPPDPYPTAEAKNRAPGWRERARALDIDGHDIWIINEPEYSNPTNSIPPGGESPADFIDLDPNPDGPDPDVWPLDRSAGRKYGLDPGRASTPVDELNRVEKAFPEPGVAWVTDDWYEMKYGYSPGNPPSAAADRPDPPAPSELGRRNPRDDSPPKTDPGGMTLTEARVEAMDRIIRLWNGQRVQGVHLLADKCPAWDEFLGDLPMGELERLFFNDSSNPGFFSRFHDHSWFDKTEFLAPQRVLRKKVWYAPTQKGKTLAFGRDEIADPRGDRKEKLRHRLTAGLVALFIEQVFTAAVSTYEQCGSFNVDVVGRRVMPNNSATSALDIDAFDRPFYCEVVTGHNNTDLHRSTYHKLSQLTADKGFAWLAFEDRAAAYDVLSYYHRQGLGSLPNGPLDSDPRISWAREQVRTAYRNDPNWPIADFVTLDWLYRHTLGDECPISITRRDATSLDW